MIDFVHTVWMSRRLAQPRRRSPRPAAPSRSLELEITGLGARGDGIAVHAGEMVFVPFTVPGDRVLARVDSRRGDGLAARLQEILVPGPNRQDPVCGHFGRCGGCSVQHLAPEAYALWKSALLVDALGRAGFPSSLVAPLLSVRPGTRRRAAFAFHHHRDILSIGFNQRASHDVIDLEECPLLAPALFATVPLLRLLLADLTLHGRSGDALVTATETGIDLLVEAEARLDLFDRQRLAAFAETHDLARLSWRVPGSGLIEPVVRRRAAYISFAGIPVEIPPGGFLQPSGDGERCLVALVSGAVAGCRSVADLYAGCGSFSFPLARSASVTAVDGNEASLRALGAAAGRSGMPIRTEVRDLVHRPLCGDELRAFQAVVFDPPRAGAAAQAEALAIAGPGKVVAVSCNPATLARDARILVQGGYRLLSVTPVDQFPWSAHLETVAVFERTLS
jgi:23S rRNA (uracil1939-C5)-methyltransferase